MAASFQVSMPEPFTFSRPEEWGRWIRRFERFRVASGLSQKDGEVQVSTLIYAMGDQADDILRSIALTEEERKTYDIVRDKLERHFVQRRNVIFERAKFNQRRQEDGEPVDSFITALYALAEHCAYYGALHDEMIRDRIVVGIRSSSLSEKLQLDAELTLARAVTQVRQAEAVKLQQPLVRLQPDTRVWSGRGGPSRTNRGISNNAYANRSAAAANMKHKKCAWCGKQSTHTRAQCPARGETCNHCGKQGHFQAVCRSPAKVGGVRMSTVSETERTPDPGNNVFLGAINDDSDSDDPWAIALTLDGKPVAFISRSMSPTERRYAQIEKEALAFTWACERLSDYLVGLQFHIYTDRKPLVPLFSFKYLEELPLRVQRFRLRMMRFHFTISHVPGKELTIADALSRAPVSTFSEADERLQKEATAFVNLTMQYFPATEQRLQELRECQEQDTVCQKLVELCRSGWPEKSALPPDVKPYSPVSAQLSIENGLLLRGGRIVVPPPLRKTLLNKLHDGHQGITKCRELARQSVWWPGLSKQLEELVLNCRDCLKVQRQRSQPLSNPSSSATVAENSQRPFRVEASDIHTRRRLLLEIYRDRTSKSSYCNRGHQSPQTFFCSSWYT